MQGVQHWGHVFPPASPGNNSGCRFLHSLQASDLYLGDAEEKGIAILKFHYYESMHQTVLPPCHRIGACLILPIFAQVIVSSFADSVNLFVHTHITVSNITPKSLAAGARTTRLSLTRSDVDSGDTCWGLRAMKTACLPIIEHQFVCPHTRSYLRCARLDSLHSIVHTIPVKIEVKLHVVSYGGWGHACPRCFQEVRIVASQGLSTRFQQETWFWSSLISETLAIQPELNTFHVVAEWQPQPITALAFCLPTHSTVC